MGKTDTQLREEAFQVRKATRIYGGSFIQQIGEATGFADRNNLRKIYDTWTEEWEQYLSMYKAMTKTYD